MKNLIVGFSRPRHIKLYARLIMFFDNSPFNHAYLKFNSESLERDIIYQAIGKGVEFRGKKLFEEKTQPVEEYKLSIEDGRYKNLMQFCIDHAGINYGLKQIFGTCLVKLASKFGKKIKNPFGDGLKSAFCSEIAAACLNIIYDNKVEDIESITPRELRDLVANQGAERVL